MKIDKKTEDFLQSLKNISALKFGDFTLASGKHSKFYLDLRYLPSFPDFFIRTMKDWYESVILPLEYDIIIPIPLAGLPFGTALSMLALKPLHILRKSTKTHGMNKLIEGPNINGKRILLVDDLISSGFSKEQAINAIRKEGGIVDDLCVLVDRRPETPQINKNWLDNHKIQIKSLYRLSPDLLNNYENSIKNT